ncbi:MAG: phosphoglycerate dehydrogenase [Acidobacteria bacterium]|nr:phosphoglycerate dehydrogenase [Acidobacteriota bacterium]
MRILVSDDISESALGVFSGTGWSVQKRTGLKSEELAAIIAEYDALLVRSATKVTRELLTCASKLRVVGRAGMGVDNIDVEAATVKGVVVMNTPGANTISTAEHAMALLLAAAKHVTQAAASMKAGRWDKKSFVNMELRGKTLGIIGLGRIGQEVARRAAAFEMRLMAYDPFVSESVARSLHAHLAPLDQLLAESDFVSLHATLTAESRNLIDATALGRMKPGAVLINCARGDLVDEDAVLEALESKRIACAALDVFKKEPLTDYRLASHPNVIPTPHLAASTSEAQELVGVEIARQIYDYLKDGIVRNAVNVSAIPVEDRTVVEPFLTLGGRLGAFAAQITQGRMEEVEIEYHGDALHKYANTISSHVLRGLLGTIIENVNEVNALHIARSRGIRLREEFSPAASPYPSLIGVRLRTDETQTHLEGTAFNHRLCRLVSCDGLPLDIHLGGGMLFIRNRDVPGVIGQLGTALGGHTINIGQMSLSRNSETHLAMAVLSVDGEVGTEVVEELRRITAVEYARYVEV